MCPDQESNLQPFGVQDDALTYWTTWPGFLLSFNKLILEVMESYLRKLVCCHHQDYSAIDCLFRNSRTCFILLKLNVKTFIFLLYFILKISFISRERGREGEREGEKHPRVVASWAPTTGDLAHNPGMCPDWDLNWRPFGLQASIQSTEPHQPGRWYEFL